MNRRKAVLYDNLEFNHTNFKDDEREQAKTKPESTVMEEYEDNYYWSDTNMGRAGIASLVAIVKRGLKL